MIVKVQVSLFGSETTASMLVYDQHRDYVFEGPVTAEVLIKMTGENKKYFTAELVGTRIEVDQEVEKQDW